MKHKYLALLAMVIVCLATLPINVRADDDTRVPVAILKTNADGTRTLTFTMRYGGGTGAVNGDDGIYELNTGNETPGWIVIEESKKLTVLLR